MDEKNISEIPEKSLEKTPVLTKDVQNSSVDENICFEDLGDEKGGPLPSEPTKIDEIYSVLISLSERFDRKINTDEHKNRMFDNMHKELTDFRNGVVEKNVELMAKDIISLIDTYEAIADGLPSKDGDEEYMRASNALRNIIEDLIDALYRQDIERYTSIDDSLAVNVKSQKIIKVVETNDASMHNKICSQIAPGYVKGDKIIRHEKISIYKYKGE